MPVFVGLENVRKLCCDVTSSYTEMVEKVGPRLREFFPCPEAARASAGGGRRQRNEAWKWEIDGGRRLKGVWKKICHKLQS